MAENDATPSILTPGTNLPSMAGLGQPAAPPNMGGVLPPSNPVTPDIQAQLMQQSQAAQQQMGESITRSRQAGDLLQQLIAQKASMPVPKMGPQIEHGAGFLHNLGQALLMAAGATGPGRSLQSAIYGPNVRGYEAGQSQLAQQIAETQARQKGEEVPITAEAQSTWRPYSAYGSIERGNAAMMNAQTNEKMQPIRNELKNKQLDIEARLGQGKLTNEQAAIEMRQTVAELQAKAAVTVGQMYSDATIQGQQTGAARELLQTESNDWMQRVLGNLPFNTPQMPVPTQQPQSAAPSAPKKPAAKSTGRRVVDLTK